MPMNPRIKRALFKILTQPAVNRTVVRPLRRTGVGRRVDRLKRLPVVGSFTASGFGGRSITLESQGRDSIASRLFWKGLESFEPESLAPFCNLAGASSAVLDIGANTGIYALVAAASNPDAQVIAFEPVPEIFQYLARNAELNGFAGLRVEQIALGDRTGEIEFYVPEGVTLATGGSAAAGYRDGVRALPVTCTTLDDYLASNGEPQIDLIKMDTESTEPQVIDGAANTLARCRPVILCEVLRGRTETELEARLAPIDYTFLHVTDRGLEQRTSIVGDATYAFKNFMFVPRERLDWVRGTSGVPLFLLE